MIDWSIDLIMPNNAESLFMALSAEENKNGLGGKADVSHTGGNSGELCAAKSRLSEPNSSATSVLRMGTESATGQNPLSAA